jgi:hypothetical protein
VVAHAAVLEPRIRCVVALGPLLSYRCLLEDPLYQQPFSSFLPGVIGAYEVRDILAAIAPRRLLVLNPEDARRRPAASEAVAKELEWTVEVYRAAGAADALAVRTGVSGTDVGATIARWLPHLSEAGVGAVRWWAIPGLLSLTAEKLHRHRGHHCCTSSSGVHGAQSSIRPSHC